VVQQIVLQVPLPEGAKSGPWDSSFEDYEKDWFMPKQ
jgi:hypothetical protein